MKTLVDNIVRVQDIVSGKAPTSAKRSGQWRSVRSAFLKDNPVCAVCGGDKKLEVHHKHPFHLKPELELDPSNLIVLCEASRSLNCHLVIGHLNNFRGWNPDVDKDALEWKAKITENKKRIGLTKGDNHD